MTQEFENIEKHPNFLYGDEQIIVMFSLNPVSPGELQIFPKEKFTIIEQAPNDLVGKMFSTANKLSTILFESLNCQGTNIVVENGVPAGQKVSRFSINIIPRRENDGLNYLWNPQKLSEDQINTSFLKLEQYAKTIVIEEQTKTKVVEESPKKEIKQQDGQINYKLEQFKRIP